MKNTKGKYQGFTLIEVLMVIVLLIFLFAIVIVAINPAEHLRNARNTQRSSDVTQILNAALQYTADMDEDNQTRYPGGDGDSDLGLPECSVAGLTDIADVDREDNLGDGRHLYDLLVDNYIADFPQDPHVAHAASDGTAGVVDETGYLICYDEFDDTTDTNDGRIVVVSELAEDPYEQAVADEDPGDFEEGDDYIKVRR